MDLRLFCNSPPFTRVMPIRQGDTEPFIMVDIFSDLGLIASEIEI